MRKSTKAQDAGITFTGDNVGNLRKVVACCKNTLICGVKGVGKITNTVNAVRDNTNVFYIGNPVDFEGKTRPGSFEKYLAYISSLKHDLRIVNDMTSLFSISDQIILIIDELYGRSTEQIGQINRLLSMPNIRVLQIVGCLKYTGEIIDNFDIIVELHLDGAFVIDNDLGKAICRILGKGSDEH